MAEAIIIGAGVAGLASAIRLKAKGYQVTLLEKNAYTGGKISSSGENGYRFDDGPSLLTQPEKIDALFHLLGENPRDFITYTKLDPIARYFWEDGTHLESPASPEKLAEMLENKLGEPAQNTLKFLRKSEKLYALSAPFFLEGSFHRKQDFQNAKFLRQLFHLPKYQVFTTMHRAISQQFYTEKARQFFMRYATYNGSNPYLAPATLNAIPSLEYSQGAYLPAGGMRKIVDVLHDLCLRHGVVIKTQTEVERIVHRHNSVKGVFVDGTFLPAQLVVSNADVYFTYRKLLNDTEQAQKILRRERSTSALVFNWGIAREFPELGLHNLFFSQDYRREFLHLSTYKTLYEDPTLYIFISAKEEKADAPAGKENWFVMVNAPENTGQNWQEIVPKARRQLLKKIQRILGTDIEPFIEYETCLSPVTIEQRTYSFQGSLYGSASNSRMAAFQRHPNESRAYKNLFFAGGSVHPGGGIPLCLSGAEIMANLVPEV